MIKIALNYLSHLFLSGALLLLCVFLSFAYASKNYNITIDGADNTLTKQEALERKTQWNDTQKLRQKRNTRIEKEFDKYDKAIDDEDSCRLSKVLTAYWEPITRRCLDSRTGNPINP